MPAIYVVWIAGGWLFGMLSLPGANYAKLDAKQHVQMERAPEEHFWVKCAGCGELLDQCSKVTPNKTTIYRICRNCYALK